MKNTLVLLFALPLFVHCGGGRPTGPSGTMSQSQASSLAGSNGGGTSLASLAAAHDPANTQAAFLGSAGRDCTPTKSGDSTDADGDGVPLNELRTFNCNSSGAGYSSTVTGTLNIADGDDTKAYPLGGATLAATNLALSLTLGSRDTVTLNVNFNGSHKVTSSATAFTVATDIKEDIAVSGKSGSGRLILDAVLTPTSMAASKDAGAVTSLSGFVSASYPGNDFTLAVTGTGLTWSKDCAGANRKNFQAGTLTFTDGKGNKLDFIYTACQAAYKYNGATITARDI